MPIWRISPLFILLQLLLVGCESAVQEKPARSTVAHNQTEPVGEHTESNLVEQSPSSTDRSTQRIDLVTIARKPEDAPRIEPEKVNALRSEKERLFSDAERTNVEFAPDGSRVYCGDSELGIVVYDTATWKSITKWPTDGPAIQQIVLSRDGNTLVAADAGRTATVWNTKTGTALTRHQHEGAEDGLGLDSWEVVTLAISPDGKQIVTSDANTLDYIAWDTATGREQWRKKTRWYDLKPASFHPEGQTVALWGDKELLICDAQSGTTRQRIPMSGDSLHQIIYSPSGDHMAVVHVEDVGGERTVFLGLLASETGRLEWSAQAGPRWHDAVTFSPDGSMIFLAGELPSSSQSVVECRDIRDGTLKFTIMAPEEFHTKDIAVSPDGTLIVCREDVWKLPNSESVANETR